MDELMMNMFSLIADRVRDRRELFDEEGRIMQALLNQGYHLHEADAALTLMQTLVGTNGETVFGTGSTRQAALMRTMNSEERRRFTPEAFSFVLKLSHLGVLTEDQTEELLDKAATLSRGRIHIGHIKALVAFTLFAPGMDRDEQLPGIRVIRDTDWN